jgi:hypothetical protein
MLLGSWDTSRLKKIMERASVLFLFINIYMLYSEKPIGSKILFHKMKEKEQIIGIMV